VVFITVDEDELNANPVLAKHITKTVLQMQGLQSMADVEMTAPEKGL
jgi:hypothetical protein